MDYLADPDCHSFHENSVHLLTDANETRLKLQVAD